MTNDEHRIEAKRLGLTFEAEHLYEVLKVQSECIGITIKEDAHLGSLERAVRVCMNPSQDAPKWHRPNRYFHAWLRSEVRYHMRTNLSYVEGLEWPVEVTTDQYLDAWDALMVSHIYGIIIGSSKLGLSDLKVYTPWEVAKDQINAVG